METYWFSKCTVPYDGGYSIVVLTAVNNDNHRLRDHLKQETDDVQICLFEDTITIMFMKFNVYIFYFSESLNSLWEYLQFWSEVVNFIMNLNVIKLGLLIMI